MSARIGIIDNGQLKSIFLFNSSKSKELSNYLRQNFKKKESVEELINLGDMNSLGKTIDSCRYFCRDCGDKWEGCTPYVEEANELIDIDTNASPIDRYFIFHKNKWFTCEAYTNNWITITKFINSLKTNKCK